MARATRKHGRPAEAEGEGNGPPSCSHLGRFTEVEPLGDVCDECVRLGDGWVHLRACLHCGLVGCCDASKNRHARAHWEQSGHQVIRSLERGETWKYCFPDHFLQI